MKVTAIVPAAGAGSRIAMKKGRRKPFFVVSGKPILIHALLALEKSGKIDDIILVVRKEDISEWKGLLRKFGLKKVREVIPGGRTRLESVKNGLSFTSGADMVFIHDGVRPLIDKRMIRDSIKACARFGAAICGVPVISTIKSVSKALTVNGTPDRRSLYDIQTPQVFRRDIIIRACKRGIKDPSRATDDSMMVERLGHKIKVVPGSYSNIKVTTPQDLVVLKALLGRR